MHERAAVYQDEPRRKLQRFLEPWLDSGEVLTMLDAGCGAELPIDIPLRVRLVGLDASPEALARNENIDEALLGDLVTFSLPPQTYDGILCWTVLEHISQPAAALANMAKALKPSGLLIVGVPNLWSMKGLITKFTPHWFHVWAYRHVYRIPEAGLPGHGPYRTYLRRDVAPEGLHSEARRLGLERIYESTYPATIGLPPTIASVWSGLCKAAYFASLRRWQPENSEHIAVFRKA